MRAYLARMEMSIAELIKSAVSIYEIFQRIYRKLQLRRKINKLNKEIDKIMPSLSPLARDIISSLVEQKIYTRDYWISIPGIRSSLNGKKHRRFKGLVEYDPEFAKALKELGAKKIIILKDDSFSFIELDPDELPDEVIEQICKQDVTLNTKHKEIKAIIDLRLAS